MRAHARRSRKRILLLLPEVFGRTGGIQMFNRALCMAAGHWAQLNDATVSAIVLNDGGAPDRRYINDRYVSYISANKSKAKFIWSFIGNVATKPPDLTLIAHISLSPLTLLPLASMRNQKSCIVAHGIEAWKPLRRIERKALRLAETILAVSEYTRDELVRHNDSDVDTRKVKIFPCTLDPFWVYNSQARTILGERPIILTVCRMMKEDAYKGVDSVLRSLPAVVREYGPVDYQIVGQGNDVPRLKALAEELGISPYVTFTGSVSDEELRENYQQCSLFVMPSEKEGFGIVFLEAMAYAKPVIGGAHGGILSVVENEKTGLLVNRLDVDALARAMVRLLQDRELSDRLGRNGRQRLMEEFTYQRFENNLGAVINSCL